MQRKAVLPGSPWVMHYGTCKAMFKCSAGEHFETGLYNGYPFSLSHESNARLLFQPSGWDSWRDSGSSKILYSFAEPLSRVEPIAYLNVYRSQLIDIVL